MPQQKHRRRWRRKGMCCMPAPRPCIDSMPRRCMPHCAVCPPCPSAQHITASSSSHSECSCEEEKFCTVDSCKNAPQCITAKLKYCPYGFKDKSGSDLRPDQAHSREMLEYQPSQEREMRAQYPQAASTPYMQPQAQPGGQLTPEFAPSGYASVPTISSIHSRAPDQFDQSMPQYVQQMPVDAVQGPIMQQDFGPPGSQAQMQGRMTPISPESQAQMQSRMMPISPESQPQIQGRMMPISPEYQAPMQGRIIAMPPESQPQMQQRMMPVPPESQAQMQGRMTPISPESQVQMQGRMMPIPPESQPQMQQRMMPISPESQAQMQGRYIPISPEPQAQMQQRMIPRPDTMPSPVSVTSGPSIQIRTADQFQPYYTQPQDTMPSYDYPATRRPIPVSQEEGYMNIPRAEKQVGGYSPAQYSLGPAPEDSIYPSGPPPPQFDPGQKYSLSAVSSADRMKPRPIIIQDEPRRMPQYTSATEYVPSDRPLAPSPRPPRVQQPVPESSYVRYVSESPTSPAPSERIPSSRPVSTEGLARTVYRPPYQADTSMGVPYQADTSRGVPYQADISRGAPYQADTSRGVPYQADVSRGVPYQADISMGTPYQAEARMGAPYPAEVRAGAPYQAGTRTGAPYQADTRMGAPYQDTRTGYQPSVAAEPVPKKSVHHALPDTTYDTSLPLSPSAPEMDVTMDRSRRGYQPMPSGYESAMESPPTMVQSPPSRYPIGRPLAESTSIGSSRNIPMDYSAGPPLSPPTSMRTSEQRPTATDGLHKISYRGPSTGYNKFCKEPPQPEYVDKSVGFEYPVPQSELGASDETPPKCSCRFPPAFKHLECAGLMSGTCECNENDL
ncbi:Ribosome-binding protein 1 [Papilio xuthus]|uniref:Ribosome-binding protein 1 n=1 Tax=Papilio xuthus TaxID=66420 RepID=A0A194Q0V8_PAPXU|nr:Ribosome-binding protein 1 [Papilio xuthus]